MYSVPTPTLPRLEAIVVVARILQYALAERMRQRIQGKDQSESISEQAPETHLPQQGVPPSLNEGATTQSDIAAVRQLQESSEAGRPVEIPVSSRTSADADHAESFVAELEWTEGQYIERAWNEDSETQFNIGCRYLMGWSVKRDLPQAIRWFQRAAQHGHAEAQFNLGVIYDTGDGIRRDLEKAAEWYQKSARQGYAKAQFNLAVLYHTGDGVAKSDENAANWFRKAAEQGIAAAQNNVGTFYETGTGVEMNIDESAQWYRKAADKGLRESQYMLGVKYGRGDGLSLDEIESFRWIRYAANQGHTASQWLVASFYFEGRGVFQDRVEAYRWALLAKYRDQNVDPLCAKMFREIRDSLDPDQIRYDKNYARQWKEKDWEQIMPTRSDPEQIETPDGPLFRLDAPILAVKKLLGRWQVSADQTANFMGFNSSMQEYVEELLTGHRMLVQGSETEDRIALLYYIRCVLGALFQDKQVENEWLRRPHPELDGKSPMDLMQSGPRTDLLVARHHVDWVSGRLGC